MAAPPWRSPWQWERGAWSLPGATKGRWRPSGGASALMTVRPYGRVVLMGGVGMLGGDELALPYPWIMRNCVSIHGQWMYPPAAVPRMVAMIHAGLLDLGQFDVTEFRLDEANQAVAHAAAHAKPFRITVLRP